MVVMAAVAVVAAGIVLLNRAKPQVMDGPGMVGQEGDSLTTAVAEGVQSTAVAASSDIQVPELMMTGPLDPIPDESSGEYYVVVVANLGPFTSLEQLRQSPFYPQLCSAYPELPDINTLVDTGKGDLWLLKPWTENTSLSLNEYNINMFLGEQEPGTGKVYYRTENAGPMLLRMTTDDPGSVLINAVDNEGHQLSWAPASRPADNVLREEPGMVNITFNPVDNSVEFGADYEAQVNDEPFSIRFYADRQMYFGDRLMRYYAFLLNVGESVGLLISDHDRQCFALIDGYAPDQGFTLTPQQGDDMGLGMNQPVYFKRQ